MTTLLHALAASTAPASMESILLGVEQAVLSGRLAPVTGVAVSLAAALTAISIIGVGAKYLRGKEFDPWLFARPILVFFLVCNFSSLVLGPVRAVAGVYNTRLAAAVGGSTETFKALFRERTEQMCLASLGPDGTEEEEDEGGEGGWLARTARRLATKVTRSFYRINARANLGAATLVSGVLFFLMDLSVSVMVIVAQVCLTVMALIGPYTFAISILTPFTGGIKLWVERYVQFTLWQPLLHTVMYIGTEVLIQGNRTVTWGGFWTWCFMIVAIFMAIRQVPSFASFIIESAGTEALADKLAGGSRSAIGKAGGALTRMI